MCHDIIKIDVFSTFFLKLTMFRAFLMSIGRVFHNEEHKKARLANDQNKQREIIFNADPITQKLLGQEVKGLNKEEWNHQKRDLMKDILISKFTQHPDLKDLLLKTGTKKLAEANARDNYFAIGLPITHPDVLDTTKWSENGNKLGEILMELRDELRS